MVLVIFKYRDSSWEGWGSYCVPVVSLEAAEAALQRRKFQKDGTVWRGRTADSRAWIVPMELACVGEDWDGYALSGECLTHAI